MIRRVALLILAMTFVASPVRASTPSEAVGVVPLNDRSGRDALMVERAVRDWVARSSAVELVDPGELALGEQREELEARVEQARTIARSGIEAYDMMSYETALMRLERAIEAFEQSDLTRHLDELLDLYVMRALTLFYEGQPSRARHQLLDAFALRRDFNPDRSRLTPELETMVDEARRSVDDAAPTSLEIQTEPVPARVYVDGRFRGISPVEVSNLQPGHHYVTVWAPGYGLAQERHLAAPGQIARVHIEPTARGRELLQRLEAVRSGLSDGNPSGAAAGFSRWANADQALVVGVRGDEDGMRLIGWRVAADGHIEAFGEKRLSRRELEQGGPLNAFLDELHGESLPRGPNGEPVREIQTGISFDLQFGPKHWGATVGGAGALLAGGGLIVGLSAQSQARAARGIYQLDVEDYQGAMQSARRRALIADGLYVAAIVGVGTGVYLFMQDELPWARTAAAPRRVDVAFVPTSDGAALSVGGRF
jgi:hypothetical protein